MASGPTSSQTEDENVKTVTDFVFLGSKITAGGHCSYEVKRCLLLGRKAMKNPDSILKSRDITLPTNTHSQSYGLSNSYVQMWMLAHKEGWHRRTDAFELWCWSRLFQSPLNSKEIKPIKPKEIDLEYALEELVLRLKLQYFGHLMRRAHSLEKALMLGKIGGRRRRGRQRMWWLDSITGSMDMNLSKLQEIV